MKINHMRKRTCCTCLMLHVPTGWFPCWQCSQSTRWHPFWVLHPKYWFLRLRHRIAVWALSRGHRQVRREQDRGA